MESFPANNSLNETRCIIGCSGVMLFNPGSQLLNSGGWRKLKHVETPAFTGTIEIAVSLDDSKSEPTSIVVTYTDMFLVKENHQWPIPRLQAPLNDEVKGQQFYVKDSQKINNIATFECCEEDPTQVKVTFFNEESQEEVSWHMIMATLKGVQSLVNAIREPWESEFGVNLDISSVSLNDM